MYSLCEKASDETEVMWDSLLLPEWKDKYVPFSNTRENLTSKPRTSRYLKNRWSCLRSSLLDDCLGLSFRGTYLSSCETQPTSSQQPHPPKECILKCLNGLEDILSKQNTGAQGAN